MKFPTVQVASGKSLNVHGIWKGFSWRMQGLEFVCGFRMVDLNTYDVVLGLK